MHTRYGLYFIGFLVAACCANPSDTVVDIPKSPECAEVVIGKKSKLLENVEHLDAGAEVVFLTEQMAREMGALDVYQKDPGYDKWYVLFHEIPGKPPYALQQKRLVQTPPDVYYPCGGPPSPIIFKCKICNQPTGIIVSSRGYLPGEKITIRLSAQDAYREAIFYPRPLFLKKRSGELLVKGTLLDAEPGHTLYSLDICGVGKQEKYKQISYSGTEILSDDLEGPKCCFLLPEVLEMLKGVAKVEWHLEDGAVYTMQLPWGYELHAYKLGKK